MNKIIVIVRLVLSFCGTFAMEQQVAIATTPASALRQIPTLADLCVIAINNPQEDFKFIHELHSYLHSEPPFFCSELSDKIRTCERSYTLTQWQMPNGNYRNSSLRWIDPQHLALVDLVSAKLFKLGEQKSLASYRSFCKRLPFFDFLISPDDNFLVINVRNEFYLINLRESRIIETFKVDAPREPCIFTISPDSTHFALYDPERTIIFYDLARETIIRICPILLHGAMTAMAFSPDNCKLAFSNCDTVKILTLNNNHIEELPFLPDFGIKHLEYSPNGLWIAAGLFCRVISSEKSPRGFLKLYHVPSGQWHDIGALQYVPKVVRWQPNSQYLAVFCWDAITKDGLIKVCTVPHFLDLPCDNNNLDSETVKHKYGAHYRVCFQVLGIMRAFDSGYLDYIQLLIDKAMCERIIGLLQNTNPQLASRLKEIRHFMNMH